MKKKIHALVNETDTLKKNKYKNILQLKYHLRKYLLLK